MWGSNHELRELTEKLERLGYTLTRQVIAVAAQTRSIHTLIDSISVLRDQITELRVESAKIYKLLYRPAAGFLITESNSKIQIEGESMTPISRKVSKIGRMKLQILPGGNGKYVATVVDKDGNPPNPPGLPPGVVPAWKSSDPTVIQITVDPTDPTGLTALVKALKSGTGIITTISAVIPDEDNPDQTKTISQDSLPANVAPAPGGAAGFVITESNV